MRSLLVPLLLAASTAAVTLKGSQHRHEDVLNRLLKKEDEQPLTELMITTAPTGKPTALPTVVPTLTPSGLPSIHPSIEDSEVPSLAPSARASSDQSDAFLPEPEAPAVDVTISPTPAPTATADLIDTITTESPTPSPLSSTTFSTESTSTAIEGSVSIVPLKAFRVDLVSTIQHEARNLRVSAGNTASSSTRKLEFFESLQDAQLLHVISSHIKYYLQQADTFGEVLAVQLKIVDKIESVFGTENGETTDEDASSEGSGRKLRPDLSLVLVSYTFEGEVLLTNSASNSNQLEEVMLQSFMGEEEQSSLLATLSTSNDKVLRSITDVDATSIIPLEFVNEIVDAPNTAADEQPAQKVNIIFPTVIGIAFLSTLSAIGFLVHRKYREYRSNEYASYQQRKRNNNYNHFESPESSVTENVTPTSRDAEMGAAFAYDYSVEESSSEDERGWSSASTSTDVMDWQVPFDEHSLGRQMPYEDQTKMELRMIQMGISKHDGIQPGTIRSVSVASMDEDATLDGLYSTADSYFDANTALSRNRRCDSIDTANFSTDQQAFGPGWEREVNFEGILDVMHDKELVTDVTKILLQNCVTTNESGSKEALETPKTKCQPQDKPTEEDQESPNSTTSKHPSSYKSMYTPSDPTALSKANISAGIFTQETLGMINRNRLKSTPPPSENEYDEDVVKDSKENSLLGKWTVDSDEEEDTVFESVNAAVGTGYGVERMG